MLLTYRDLTVRTAAPTDAARLAAWWNDGTVMAHAGFPLGLGVTEAQVAGQICAGCPGVRELLLIEQSGVPIGEMNYRTVQPAPGTAPLPPTAEIGIKICRADCQNNGLGKVLLSLLIRELFRAGFAAIVLDTNPDNLRARQVYRRLGFEQAGLVQNNWRDQLGRPQSTVYYRLEPAQFVDFAH